MINVTKSFLPPKDTYIELLTEVWDSNWLTNHGPKVNQFEDLVREYTKINNFKYLANGTLALQIAIKSCLKKKRIITTPFSYVATTSSLLWENYVPVFVDIDPSTLNIDPIKIRENMSSDIGGILATHVYGNACQIDEIETIAREFSIPVIYDGAHCFGSKFKGESIFSFGDISICSFHATKIFHTVEGGGVFVNSDMYYQSVKQYMNFGHSSPNSFSDVGINAKNCEFHAAMGIGIFPYFDQILKVRKDQWLFYYNQLIDNEIFRTISIHQNCEFNYAYFPLIMESEEKLLKVIKTLQDHEIVARRYFYPSLNRLYFLPEESKNSCPISEDISERVVCLPLFHDLSKEIQNQICKLIKSTY